MPKTNLSNNNFSTGLVNQAVNGRYDLPIYKNGLSLCENFIVSYEGGLKNRTGLIKKLDSVESVFIPFIFNKEQSYLVQFTATKIRFLTYSSDGTFGYILDGSNNIYELTSPYTLAEARLVKFTQNSDVMYLAYKDYIPKKLTRTSATTFTIADVIFTGISPFTVSTGYPSAVCIYENRLFYGGIKNKPTFIYASDVGYYDKFSLTGTDDNLDGFTFDLAETNTNIDWIFPAQNTLLAGTKDGILYMDGGSVGTAMTKVTFRSRKASDDGSNGSIPMKNDNIAFFIDTTESKVRSFTYDLVGDTFNTNNLNLLNTDFTIDGLKSIKTVKNKDNFSYVLKNDGTILFFNYLQNENINTWTSLKYHNEIVEIQNLPRGYDEFEDLIFLVKENNAYYICIMADFLELKNRDSFYTGNKKVDDLTYQRYLSEQAKYFNYLDMSNVYNDDYISTITYNPTNNTITSTEDNFTNADIGKHIVYKTATGKDFGIFKIISYNTAKIVGVELVNSTYTSLTSSSWYKSFSTITIADSYYYNKTVSVVADGGYIGDYTFNGSGFIDFEKQITSIVIGFKYTAIAKSLNLGYEYNGVSTQITNKNISQINMRFINSAGGSFSTDRYNQEDIQDFNPDGYYDNIPLLMNGDKKINYQDNWSAEKSFYIIQDKPLPFNITMLTIQRDDNLV